MMTIDSLIAIISLVLTAFGLGYTIGSNSTKKELLTTIKPNLDNDEADKVTAKIEETVSSLGGSILETEKLGRKKLAYDVQGFRDGFMVVQKMNIPADKIVEFKRNLKLNENVIRTMFTEVKKA